MNDPSTTPSEANALLDHLAEIAAVSELRFAIGHVVLANGEDCVLNTYEPMIVLVADQHAGVAPIALTDDERDELPDGSLRYAYPVACLSLASAAGSAMAVLGDAVVYSPTPPEVKPLTSFPLWLARYHLGEDVAPREGALTGEALAQSVAFRKLVDSQQRPAALSDASVNEPDADTERSVVNADTLMYRVAFTRLVGDIGVLTDGPNGDDVQITVGGEITIFHNADASFEHSAVTEEQVGILRDATNGTFSPVGALVFRNAGMFARAKTGDGVVGCSGDLCVFVGVGGYANQPGFAWVPRIFADRCGIEPTSSPLPLSATPDTGEPIAGLS